MIRISPVSQCTTGRAWGLGIWRKDMSIFRKLTVEENILAILETTKLPREKQRERLEMLLEELGIAHLAKNVVLTRFRAASGGAWRLPER
ncbi:MAG: hypothetical protein KatS3mg130_1564 [Candidatus Sumerlaea sp.]|nr:MAG: hypothetical protein KatS3mg130_1564 [Candidatus Sumerlaea sp.]